MKCPYCAEPILDDAVTCKHCQRDLSLIRTLNAKIADLERELVEARAQISTVDSRPLEKKEAPVVPDVQPLTKLIAVGAYLYVIYYGYYIPIDEASIRATFWHCTIVFGGIALGSLTPVEQSLAEFFRITLFVCLCVYVGTHIYENSIKHVPYDARSWLISFCFCFLPTLLLFTGALLRRWFVRRKSTARQQDFADRLASKLVSSESNSQRGSAFEKVANIISTLAPILTFIASLFTAYLGYLGAVAAHKYPLSQ